MMCAVVPFGDPSTELGAGGNGDGERRFGDGDGV